jgi:hypothetical protein
MKTKLSILGMTLAIAVLAVVPSAYAAGSSIKVTTIPDFANICRPTPDQVRFNFEFHSKIKKKNTTNPKSVVVNYSVEDAATGSTIASGKVTLKPNNSFRKQSSAITVAADESLIYHYKATYRAPNTGKNVTAKATSTDHIPSTADMDSANAANPTSPPFPDCSAVPAG